MAKASAKKVAKKPAKKPPAGKTASKTAPATKSDPTAIDDDGGGWIDAGNGYQLTLDGGKLVCRNDKGKKLSSVPKEIKDGDIAEQLEALHVPPAVRAWYFKGGSR